MKINHKVIKREFLSYIKNERGYSDHTISSYRIDISIFLKFCSEIFSDDLIDFNIINSKTIRKFLATEIDRGYSNSNGVKSFSTKTLKRRLATVKSFFNYLYSFEKINDNPALHVKTPKIEKKLPNFISEDLIEELMNTPVETPITNKIDGIRDKAILELFYATGLRLNELLSLNICDVDEHEAMVKVMGKGSKERIVPIGNSALNSMNKYLEEIGKSLNVNFNDPIFINKKGKRLPKRTLQERIKKYLYRIMGNGSVHTLRHTFATHLMDRGADILTIKEFLGHSSLSSTQLYTSINPETIKNSYNKSHPRG